MSKAVKIGIGCLVVFLLVSITAVVGIGYLTVKAAAPFTGVYSQTTRMAKLDQSYAFTEPSNVTTIDQTRFDSFMTIRTELLSSIENAEEFSQFITIMENGGQSASNQNFGFSEISTTMEGVTQVMKATNDEMENQQMGPTEYGFNNRELFRLIYFHALDGDEELQTIWNDLERTSTFGTTDWELPVSENEARTDDYAWFLMQNLKARPDQASMDAFDQYRDKVVEEQDYITIEIKFLEAILNQ